MGNRLSKIYTRTGDDGTTGLGDGTRTTKTSSRVEAMGAVDELNSVIGLLISQSISDVMHQTLSEIQHTLFDLGGELSLPGHQLIQKDQVTRIENALDQMNETLAPLKDFILPGGSPSAAFCHQARSVCRRAERRLLLLAQQETVSPISTMYLNRLSDLLFVMARNLNQTARLTDVLWDKSFSSTRKKGEPRNR
jgi:cob(I)alamin adenosyltransferase